LAVIRRSQGLTLPYGTRVGVAPCSNVETKARCADQADLARRAAAMGARYEGRLTQVDTYFLASTGRLKLRELVHRRPDGGSHAEAELIAYERPDKTGPRVSRYERTPVTDPAALKRRFEREHGIRGVVRKQRELWLAGATRIHLDAVEGLGCFVELETVAAGAPGERERAEHDRIARALAIDRSQTIEGSYVDLLELE